ncbi:MAG: AarF/ABC1/UbiB kinase family protein [Anaerolineales bacterium]|uniref:ABC1 kinase family protein n=1 Tax=Candidatus Villigracilis affinis TaxID=3140682 RepID=UPI001D71DAB1|nr:AarF/ABC1/UbiB kinase family protein [Anaerolineales bacterium]MBK9601860.1 AarF/ABC1/UbiB kinase family protein [Anaerolineales bacterium]MBL0345638.1 AarF/ABC1/UbiB kinase family protein [Anaerolineales bacterium]
MKNKYRMRYWRIVLFFARVTVSIIFWDIFLSRIGLGFLGRNSRTQRLRGIAIRFRALAIHLGGVMIKVGQFLSARLDVLPPEITDELAGLQDEVPPVDYESIRVQTELELGSALDKVFLVFEKAPIAAASLGQVHRARLFPHEAETVGFENVVVKVLRPNIEQIVDVDMSALRVVGGWLKRYRPVSDRADVPAIVEEFAATIREEVDYLSEGKNAEAFATNFKGDENVYVPRVVWTRTSRRVLTLEDVSAIKITDYEAITAAGINRGAVADRLLATYLKQIFEDGFFHADPHPGNLFVSPLHEKNEDGTAKFRLTFIDFGMVGRMPERLVEGLREAVISVGLQDASRLIKAYQTLGVLLPSANIKLLEEASTQVFDRFWGMSMNELRSIRHDEMMKFGLQFRELMLTMPFQLPENLLLLGRTIGILSGMCTGLNADFNLWLQLAPYAKKLTEGENGSTFDVFLNEAGELLKTLIAIPGRTERVLGRIERGELNVQMPLVNIQISYLERSLNRLTGGIVFLGLLISGAILYDGHVLLAQGLFGGAILALFYTAFLARGKRPFR